MYQAYSRKLLLLANIVVSSQCAVYIEATIRPVGAEASVCDGLT